MCQKKGNDKRGVKRRLKDYIPREFEGRKYRYKDRGLEPLDKVKISKNILT